MLPYRNLADAEVVLGRNLTAAETFWFHYSASMPDYLLFYHNIAFLFIIFTLVPLPIAVAELIRPSTIAPFKLQPKVALPPSSFLKCYKDVLRVFFFVVGPLQLVSYPSVKLVGIRTGLPLPSVWEMAAQLVVYFLVEDYGNYWIHRAMHSKWGYEKIHHVHHEFTAPMGFAAPYAHWAEVLVLGIPSFIGPALVPGHMVTFWLWIALRQIEAIETHSGRAQRRTRWRLQGSSAPLAPGFRSEAPKKFYLYSRIAHDSICQSTTVLQAWAGDREWRATVLQP